MSRMRFHAILGTLVVMLPAAAQTITIAETGRHATVKLHPTQRPPGGFDAVSIRLSDKQQFTFAIGHPMQPIPIEEPVGTNSGLPHLVRGFTLDRSRNFFQTTYGGTEQKHTLLLFVGSSGASDANHAFLLAFHTDGTPFVALNRDQFEVHAFAETASGLQLIGKQALSEIMSADYRGPGAPYATTYDPFSVFLLSPGAPAKYSLEESRRYNAEHYVWAGSKSRGDYAVVYNLPGHRKLFGTPADRLSTFFPTKSGGTK